MLHYWLIKETRLMRACCPVSWLLIGLVTFTSMNLYSCCCAEGRALCFCLDDCVELHCIPITVWICIMSWVSSHEYHDRILNVNKCERNLYFNTNKMQNFGVSWQRGLSLDVKMSNISGELGDGCRELPHIFKKVELINYSVVVTHAFLEWCNRKINLSFAISCMAFTAHITHNYDYLCCAATFKLVVSQERGRCPPTRSKHGICV